MKKTLLLLFAAMVTMFTLSAQTIIHDNGPLINAPGAGFGGADVSHMHSGLTLYGSGHAVSSGFRIADDFIVPAGSDWTLDSIVFFAYQTGSGLTSTIDHVNFAIWNGVPGDPNSAIIAGDTTTNKLVQTTWSNIYRTTEADKLNTDRPVMRNVVNASGITLQPGTYWLSWQTGGTLQSGPWVPEITIANQPATGNSLRFDPSTGIWSPLLDNNNPQGMPFILIGSSTPTGIKELYNNGIVSVYPNPFNTSTSIRINTETLNQNSKLAIVITDALGRMVFETSLNSTEVIINKNNLTNGIYFYKLRNENSPISIGKLVVN